MADWTARIAGYLPSVAEPEHEQSLKEMLTWTGVILVLYFTLSSINITPAPFGSGQVSVVNQALQQLETFQTLLGASIGSIITLGIGPIVTASIVLQMMVGSDLLDWDTNTQSGKQKFQNSKKILAYAISIVQALGYVLSGTFGSITDPVLIFWVTAQIALGGVIIILMDEVVQKWGFGSGVGLFIAAGVSQAIYIRSASFLNGAGEFVGVSSDAVGAIPSFAATLDLTALIPVFSTIAVFAAVVYMQSMRVEIPLTFGNVRGFGQKWPLKFLYTSNMPVILIAALVSNVQIVGSTLSGANGSSILGTFSGGQAQSGLVYLLQAPSQVFTSFLASGISAVNPFDIFHILFYTSVYAFGSVLFSLFWVQTSGQDSKSVAEQIKQTGMKVPGFRKDTRVIQKVLDRYIPGLTVLSGFSVGLLAALANITNAAGGGTGILLTVMILYRLYEQLAQKHMEELHPAMKDFLQG
ncbi:preprotein translocase subunit SecY [Nanohaloarchaea archaeon]|nr:preprotein translocase subunit SecY [Candidatus Nanohaloarchaea archaeon]